MPVQGRGGHDTGWVLRAATIATLGFFAVELAAGSYARSLALVSDAWHNFSDALVLLVAWFAYYVQAKAPSERRTYGYHRAGVLAAFVAALGLLLLAGALFYWGYRWLVMAPAPNTAVMVATGAAAVIINGVISGALRRASRGQAYPRSVLIHTVGDALAGVGIVAAGVLIPITGIRALDPLLGILIAGLVVWTSWEIVAESLNILLEGLPAGTNLDQVMATLRNVPGVRDVHDLHIWSLGAHTQALSCHVQIQEMSLRESETILEQLNTVLEQRFQIRHTTVQLEHAACEAVNGCSIPPSSR